MINLNYLNHNFQLYYGYNAVHDFECKNCKVHMHYVLESLIDGVEKYYLISKITTRISGKIELTCNEYLIKDILE